MAKATSQFYGAGNDATNPSTVGPGTTPQLNTFFYRRKAVVEAQKKAKISKLGNHEIVPPHYGTKLKGYRYFPILDDRNINSEGIDTQGNQVAGNLWGSSNDITTISGKMPLLGEAPGKVNRVGITRATIEGSFAHYGFHTDITFEAEAYDTDDMLWDHVVRELGKAAGEIFEKQVAIDVINSAGVITYGGAATSIATVTGEGATPSLLVYNDFRSQAKQLDKNRCPVSYKMVIGSRNIDTVTVRDGRLAYTTVDVAQRLEDIQDNFGKPAFIPTNKYADAATIVEDEVGKIYRTKIVQHLEMPVHEGAGASVTDANTPYAHSDRGNGDKYDVHPILTVGAGSFSSLDFVFANGGKDTRFMMHAKKPNEGDTYRYQTPYGEPGFKSIEWYYGFLLIRPEWIGLMWTIA